MQPRRLVRVVGVSHTTCGSNTCGLRCISACFTSSRSFKCSCESPQTNKQTGLFLQFRQLQPLQKTPDAKHSQYSFRHRDFRQLHVCFYPQTRETWIPMTQNRRATHLGWVPRESATPRDLSNPDHCPPVEAFSAPNSLRPFQKTALVSSLASSSTLRSALRSASSSAWNSASNSVWNSVCCAFVAAQRLRSASAAPRRRSRSPERTHRRPSWRPTRRSSQPPALASSPPQFLPVLPSLFEKSEKTEKSEKS